MAATDQVKVRATVSRADFDRIEKLGDMLEINGAAAIATAVEMALPLVEEIQRGSEVIIRQKSGAIRTLSLHA